MSNAKSKPLQDQIAELDALLEWFDRPDIDLDQALKKFEQGVELTESIKEQLNKFENKVTVLKQKFERSA